MHLEILKRERSCLLHMYRLMMELLGKTDGNILPRDICLIARATRARMTLEL